MTYLIGGRIRFYCLDHTSAIPSKRSYLGDANKR